MTNGLFYKIFEWKYTNMHKEIFFVLYKYILLSVQFGLIISTLGLSLFCCAIYWSPKNTQIISEFQKDRAKIEETLTDYFTDYFIVD